jgi:hypothetical protein
MLFYNIYIYLKFPSNQKLYSVKQYIYFAKLVGAQLSNGDCKNLQSLHTFEMEIANIYKPYNA